MRASAIVSDFLMTNNMFLSDEAEEAYAAAFLRGEKPKMLVAKNLREAISFGSDG